MRVLDEILPENLWYIVGYIVADGNLSKSGRHISIVSKDIEHLVKIKSALKIDTKICMFARGGSKDKKYGRLQFSNVNFYRWLESINIGPNKSLIQGPVDLDFKYTGDFIRGVIDGDGSIKSWVNSSNGLVQWSTRIASASDAFINWMQKIILKTYQIDGKISESHSEFKNTMYSLKFGKLSSQILLNNIYYPKCLCLERKKLSAKACLLDTKKMVN